MAILPARRGGGGGVSLETFAIGSVVSTAEGNAGTTVHTWTINRFGDTSRAAILDWAVTAFGANPAAADDFVGGVFPFGSVSFLAGQTSRTFEVNVAGDTDVEPNETYLVTLSNARVTALITSATATGTITNDDSAAPTLEAETTALLARMSVQPDATRQGHINDLIAGLKTDGIWSKLGSLYVYAAHDEQSALLNWIRDQAATNSGCTFTTDQGFTAGTSTGIDWGETPAQINTAAGGGSLNSQTAGVWCSASAGTGGVTAHLGTPGPRLLIEAHTGGNEGARLNAGTTSVARVGAGRVGHRTMTRGSSSAMVPYFNGVAGSSLSSTSSTVETANVWTFRYQTFYAQSGDRAFAAYFGGLLDATEVANLHSRLNTYKTAVGA